MLRPALLLPPFGGFRRPAVAFRLSTAGWGLLPGAPTPARTGLSPASSLKHDLVSSPPVFRTHHGPNLAAVAEAPNSLGGRASQGRSHPPRYLLTPSTVFIPETPRGWGAPVAETI
jgi:hypothetical protein